jgi:hypothetical protein
LLLGLVFVVMASALQRMRLYEHEYGLTELRLYATGVIFWLGAVLIWFAFTALRGRRHLFAIGALVAGFAATAGLNVVNPDALIIRTNLSGARVDAAYLAGLSDDGIPALIKRLPSLAPPLRQQLAVLLLRRRGAAESWASLNFARTDANAALARAHSELEQLAGRGPTPGR